MCKKIVAIEQDFEKIKIYVTGKDNFLHTQKIETNVYCLAKFLIVFDKINNVWKRVKNLFGQMPK